jgi:hypothetical protein
MHVFRHPKFYDELRKKRKKFQKEQADKQASEQALQETQGILKKRTGGWVGPRATSRGASKQAIKRHDEDASKQR